MSTQIAELLELSVDEKIQLVEKLWDSIAASPNQLPLPEWQKEELDRRKAFLKANPDSGIPWDEVKKEIRESHD